MQVRIVWVVAALVWWFPRHGLGQPSDQESEQNSPNDENRRAAEAHFKQGRAFFDAGDWDRAIEEYKKAEQLAPHPLNHFNLGLAYRGKGEWTAAIGEFKRYLELDPKSSRTDEASAYIAELTKKVAAAEETKRSEEQRQREWIASGEAQRRAERQTRILRWGGIGTAAVGLVTVGVGAYYGFEARRLSNDISGRMTQWTDSDLDRLFADGESADTRFIVFTSVGAAAAITGGVVWYLGHRKRLSLERELLISPSLSGDGGSVHLQLTF